ncbi:protein of unknown function [Candidatus Nitrospira inopinata]|uniref:Uncharacterized protein n=1 Tax=Candidatus Nitrospira inopinata TaxID=1715989 RepID=A0A0S4KRI3_9BACT|nr:protein of unknown function [Candidatus Nitrospira inopinata]
MAAAGCGRAIGGHSFHRPGVRRRHVWPRSSCLVMASDRAGAPRNRRRGPSLWALLLDQTVPIEKRLAVRVAVPRFAQPGGVAVQGGSEPDTSRGKIIVWQGGDEQAHGYHDATANRTGHSDGSCSQSP